MILQDALCDIKDRILSTGYFFKFYEFASMVTIGEVTAPKYFISGDNIIDVHDFDRDGSGYIRKTGPVTIRPKDSSFVVRACDAANPPFDLVFPLRAVFAVPKSKLDNNGFSDDKLALELFNILQGVQPGVDNISSVSGRILKYETDRSKIWAEEVKTGIEPLLNLSYIYIDFELIFTASLECLQENCY